MCRVVKLTSPNLNYVIVLGAAMLMIGCIFVASPSEDVALFSIFCGIVSMKSSNLLTLTQVSYLAFKDFPECWI